MYRGPGIYVHVPSEQEYTVTGLALDESDRETKRVIYKPVSRPPLQGVELISMAEFYSRPLEEFNARFYLA